MGSQVQGSPGLWQTSQRRPVQPLHDFERKITRLDQQITGLLEQIPGISGACTSCGVTGGGGHAPGCASDQAKVLSVIERLDEITGVGIPTAQVIIAELGTGMTQFPTPGHAAAWARLTSRTIQSGTTARNGRTGKGNPYLRGAFGAAVMTAANTDTFLGERFPPETTKSCPDSFTSGGSTSMPISSQRETKNGTLSFVDMTDEMTAAMYSAGWFAFSHAVRYAISA